MQLAECWFVNCISFVNEQSLQHGLVPTATHVQQHTAFADACALHHCSGVCLSACQASCLPGVCAFAV